MPKKNILVVEDEEKIARLICKYLELNDYTFIHLTRTDEILKAIQTEKIDLVLLDIMLPDNDGFTLCQMIRRASQVPIIMVTARIQETDRLAGFNFGADDYVCKPFSPQELVARVRALLKRCSTVDENPAHIIAADGIEIDTVAQSVRVQEKKIKLTKSEYLLLKCLTEKPNHVFSRLTLVEQLSGRHTAEYERNVDTHIKNLRKKLAEAAPGKSYIDSVYGQGYRLL